MSPAARKKSRGRRRRRPQVQRARAASGTGVSLFRVAVGAVALGSEELAQRLEAVGRRARNEAGAQLDSGGETAARRAMYLAVGVAAESWSSVAAAALSVARGGRDAAGAAGAVARLPVIRRVARPGRDAIARSRRKMNALVARGRVETLEGRRLAMLLLEDTTARSVKDIADTAIRQVTHSPEVAALVKAQSTGLVTDTILEVRANSEQADDRLERRVRSWLHIGRRGNGEHVVEPAPLPAGKRPG